MGKKIKSGNPAIRNKKADAPVVNLETTGKEYELVDLFTIDGKTYQMEKKPQATIALGYLRLAATKGEDAALGHLLLKSLGAETYEALENYAELEPDDLKAVIARVRKITMGGLEGPKGS